MKKIFIFIAASLVFLSLRAQITQSASDSIVLERMSQETRQHTIHAQENVQTNYSITTSQGEELELDYPCWIYYINYLEEVNNTGHYLVVKESNGNLLEVKTQDDKIPEDLSEWRAIKWIEVPFTEYLLDSISCQWTNIPSDTVIIINSNEELENYISCSSTDNYSAIDFNQYSLLLVHGSTVYGSIADFIINGVSLLSPDNYRLNIEIQLQDTAAAQQWYTAVIVPKLAQSTTIRLNLYYPHISIWKYTNTLLDVIIILTMDSLLNRYYINTIPQNLCESYPRIKFLFFDGNEGEYLIEERPVRYRDTLDTVIYFYEYGDESDDYSQMFLRTMLSPDIMFLLYNGIAFPEDPIVYDYLFIRRNF